MYSLIFFRVISTLHSEQQTIKISFGGLTSFSSLFGGSGWGISVCLVELSVFPKYLQLIVHSCL